jgi:hypothetical protein
MVDEHIIIHNRKVDYILLMVAVALGMISTIVSNSFSDFINVIRMFDDGSFNSNSIIVLSNYQQMISLFFVTFSLGAIILKFLSLKNILINKRFVLVVFILRLVDWTINFLNTCRVFDKAYYVVNILSVLISISVIILLLFILIKNKILSPLTLIIIIFMGSSSSLNLLHSVLYSVYFNSGDLHMDMGTYITMLNYIAAFAKLFSNVAAILTVIYLVKCICKNNIFKKPVFNTLIPLGSFIVPATVLSNIFCIIYFIIYYGSKS